MPPKKQAQLQTSLETQDEWNDYISKEGLSVVDVYSAWCGPCKAVQGLFRRLKNELGDSLLKFALAKSDTIDCLEPYRDKSIPTFLLFASGVMVSVIRGALGPLLEKTIKEQLGFEHEVIEGKRQRVAVVDEALSIPDALLDEDIEVEEEEARPEPTHKQFTVMVIKPDAVQAGRVDEILERVKSQNLDVLACEEHQFTKEEAIEFYKQHEGSDHFEELVDFMCSGPCMTLVLTKGDTGEGVVEEIRDLIGPTDVEQAKEEAPESIRATYGTDKKMNAVHASDSHEVAARELAFFMPKLRLPYVPGTEPPIERTLAMIRPDALAAHKDAIFEKIREAGFEIAYEKEMMLTKEQAEEFYKEHQGKDFYDSLTTNMSSGPMMALCLAREDAVAEWRTLLTSAHDEGEVQEDTKEENLRVQFSTEGNDINPLHGSDGVESAAKEVEFFFPTEHTFCTIKPHLMDHRESIVAKIQESGFHVSMSEESTLTKEMAEQIYAKQKDKEYFDDLVTMMTTGPSLFMVLSKPDAVLGWRALMGPTDPEEAKQVNPSSLRALYGKSVLENALHGSSNEDHALEQIEQVFGPIKVLPGGTIEKVKEEGGDVKEGETGGAKEEGGGKEDGGIKEDGGAKEEGSAKEGETKDGGSVKEGETENGGGVKEGDTKEDGSVKEDGSKKEGGSEEGSTKEGGSVKEDGSTKDVKEDGSMKEEDGSTKEGGSVKEGSTKEGDSVKDPGSTKEDGMKEDSSVKDLGSVKEDGGEGKEGEGAQEDGGMKEEGSVKEEGGDKEDKPVEGAEAPETT